MQPTKVIFRFTTQNADLLEEENVLDLIRSFIDNGLISEYFMYPTIKNNQLDFEVVTINEACLDYKYYNANTKRIIKELNDVGIEFSHVVLNKGNISYKTDLQTVPGFILYNGNYSPVKSLDDFDEVPLYLLPPTSVDGTNYFNIITWNRNYESIYRLWFSGEVEEEFFYKQLIDCNSSLSNEGLTVCRLISNLTGKNSYYYLYRYPNEESKPSNEYCPSCSLPWKLPAKLFDIFEYTCHNCFIIS